MSDLSLFELFIEVADAGGISAAAQHLGLSKAALSKQIKRLEAHYSINLFVRHKQRLHLTAEGKQLLKQCRRVQQELNLARDLCRGLKDEPTGQLNVAVFPFFAKKLIYPKLAMFLQRYPKLSLQIDSTERMPNFYQDQIDLSIGYSLPMPDSDDIIQKRMVSTRYLLCASPNYFKQFGTPTCLQDLQQHHYIEHAGRGVGQALKLKKGVATVLRPHLILNSVSAMIDCAKQDVGLVQLPHYMLESSIASGELVEVLADYQVNNAGVYYYYQKLGFMQPKVRRFIAEFLQ